MTSKIKALLSKLSSNFKKSSRAVFGSWSAPSWIRFVNSVSFAKLNQFQKKKPKLFWGGCDTFLILTVAGGVGWIWYQNLPKPIYVKVTINNPDVTPYSVEELRPNPVVIHFDASVAKLEAIGKKVEKGITVTPMVEGSWEWTDDRTLMFHPAQDWPANQKYQVKFNKSLFTEYVLLETLDYEFQAPVFDSYIKKAEFYQDPINAKLKTVEATLRFTHPIDIADLEKNLVVTKESENKNKDIVTEKFDYKVSFDKFKREIYIHSAQLDPLPQDSFLIITLKPDMHAAGSNGTLSQELSERVLIPSQYNFFHVKSVASSIITNQKSDPEQVLILKTTDGVKTEQIQKNLKVYLLPQDRPATESEEGVKNYDWQSPSEITPEILAQSLPVELTPIPTEKEYDTLHSFKYKQPQNKSLYVKLDEGVKSFGGYVLSEKYDNVVLSAKYPKQLNILGEGALLSLNGERKLSIVTRAIGDVRRTLYRISPDQINNLVSQTEGDFESPYFENYNFNEENISEIFTEEYAIDNADPSQAQYQVVDFSKYLESKRGLFILQINEWDPVNKETLDYDDRRLILLTDLGLIIKNNADKTHDVFVQSLSSGNPVSGARVEVIGKNGLPVATAITDGDGHVSMADLSGLTREKTPVAYLVTKSDDISFVPYDRYDRKLDLYRFDIGGIYFNGKEQLQASLFSDRGIYRPGEKIQAGVIVKSSDWHQSLENVPLEIVFTDPRGSVVQKQKVTLPASGFLEASYQTDLTSPAGVYHVSTYVIKDDDSTLLGSTSVRVEDFMPDTMKIQTKFSTENIEGWVSPDDLKGKVSLNNLYGTPATDRRLQAKLTLSPMFPSFDQFPDYYFYNPYKLKEGFSEDLPDQRTDESGNAEFDFQLNRYAKATYRLSFFAEGFAAEGGRGVSSQSSVLVCPMSYLIGFKEDGDSSFLKKGSDHSVEFIAIDPQLKKTEKEGLKIQLVEKKYVSVLTEQSDGTFKYQSVLKEIVVSEKELKIPAEGLKYPLVTENGGDFELRIFQEDDTRVGLVSYSVADNTNLSRSLDKAAQLIMTLDKKEYQPGDEMELSIKAPYDGYGLITIERNKVYSYQWFKSSTTASVQKIRIPQGFEGNGYINVAFMRSKDSPEIFMSPLSYGVVPFKISLSAYEEPIEIKTPDLVKPGEELTIQYKTARPSKIVIYAVDEGILQFARYQTPNPLTDFFQKRALEVGTMQTLDLILPEYSIYKQVTSAGGDEAYRLIGSNLNPFKRKTDPPVVYWSGIIDADANERELSFTIPDYFNGSVRVMAIAVTDETIGVMKKTTQVRGPFVISPSAPLFVTPGDEFEVSLTLANNVVGSGKDAEIELNLDVSDEFEVIGDKIQKIKVSEMTEKSAKFKVKTKNMLGGGSLILTASFGGESSRTTTTLSVRASTPYMTRLKQGMLKSGKATVDVSETLYPNFRTLEASLSPLPLSLSKGLMNFLEGYPYGCTEQVISKAFPALALSGISGFDIDTQKANAIFEKTIHILRSRQKDDGSFVYWPPLAQSNDDESEEESEQDEGDGETPVVPHGPSDTFATLYVLHFLTDAKDLGYAVPQDMLARGKKYLTAYLGGTIDNWETADLYAYALYLMTRNGEVTSNYLANLRDFLDQEENKDKWKNSITGAYVAATYQLLKQDKEAKELIDAYAEDQEKQNTFYYDKLVKNSQYIYLLAKHFPSELKSVGNEKIQMVINPILNGDQTTLSASYATLALQAYSHTVSKEGMTNLDISEMDKDKKTQKLEMSQDDISKATFTEKAIQILFSGNSSFPIYYQTTQSGFDLSAPTEEIKQGLEIQREYRNDKGEVITEIPVGSEVEVHLKVRSINDSQIDNIVIVELLPGGFDLANVQNLLSGRSEKSGDDTWYPDYVDAREDRVLLFGGVGTNVKEFVYKIKSTNMGTYQVPGIFAESMYDSRIVARGVGGKISVVNR